jgi:hypothetical protein
MQLVHSGILFGLLNSPLNGTPLTVIDQCQTSQVIKARVLCIDPSSPKQLLYAWKSPSGDGAVTLPDRLRIIAQLNASTNFALSVSSTYQTQWYDFTLGSQGLTRYDDGDLMFFAYIIHEQIVASMPYNPSGVGARYITNTVGPCTGKKLTLKDFSPGHLIYIKELQKRSSLIRVAGSRKLRCPRTGRCSP